MKHFQLFEQFVYELKLDERRGHDVKSSKRAAESLAKFAGKLSKVDPKDFDPNTYKGVFSAVMNTLKMTDNITGIGKVIFELKNKDKCRPLSFDKRESMWFECKPEDADKGFDATIKYVKACESIFEEGIKVIQLIEKGDGSKLESLISKLASDVEKLQNMNKEWKEVIHGGTWALKSEYNDEYYKSEYGDSFKETFLKKYQSATSNKEAKDAIEEMISSYDY